MKKVNAKRNKYKIVHNFQQKNNVLNVMKAFTLIKIINANRYRKTALRQISKETVLNASKATLSTKWVNARKIKYKTVQKLQLINNA